MKYAIPTLLTWFFTLALASGGAWAAPLFKHSQTVGVIFTEDTQMNLAYLKAYHTAAQRGVGSQVLDPTIQQAYADSSDPRLAVNWLAASLSRYFATVKFYDSLDTLKAARPDVIVMLDTRSHLVSERSADVTASIRAEFYDAHFNYIGKAEGSDARSLSTLWLPTRRISQVADDITQQKAVQENALRQFDSALGKLIAAPHSSHEPA
ncbi:ATPase [Pseudomonas sp. HR96]|uniref:ATPase n=1 Tax=Pseudomonas sp. HR96 TaxID=1027966 RepID=UPI002A749265|nr:ATPase [Pseudomonas sp. HR96]WPO99472.1 ATPase [Pseudomonas sp. HR96]